MPSYGIWKAIHVWVPAPAQSRCSSELCPIIALAEACWMIEHGKSTISNVYELLAAVDADPRLEITPLNREILDRSLGIAVIDEMHDCQIVASALVLQDKAAR